MHPLLGKSTSVLTVARPSLRNQLLNITYGCVFQKPKIGKLT